MIKVIHHNTFYKRLKGLMFTKTLTPNETHFFYKCRSVHTCFMNYELKVIGLDRDFDIDFIERLKPWNLSKKTNSTKHILECHPLITKDELKEVLEELRKAYR